MGKISKLKNMIRRQVSGDFTREDVTIFLRTVKEILSKEVLNSEMEEEAKIISPRYVVRLQRLKNRRDALLDTTRKLSSNLKNGRTYLSLRAIGEETIDIFNSEIKLIFEMNYREVGTPH
jgi:phage host-nuclease inhibitor protein Gam